MKFNPAYITEVIMNSRLIGTIATMLARSIGYQTRMSHDSRGRRQYVTCRTCGNPSKSDPCFKCQKKREAR